MKVAEPTLDLTDPSLVIGALLYLYGYQTGDEQQSHAAYHRNEVGFSGMDAGILSDMAEQYLKRQWLSDRQVAFIRERLKKYLNTQLANAEIKPALIRPTQTTPYPEKASASPATPQGKRVTLDGKTLLITFAYDAAMVARVKTLPARRWNNDRKRWECPAAAETLQTLLAWGFGADKATLDWQAGVTATLAPADAVAAAKPALAAILGGTPYPFQWAGLDFLERRGGRALLADEMGLGKTVQALMYVAAHPELTHVVIVCPASLRLNWQREAQKWLSQRTDIQILRGSIPRTVGAGIHIINYDVLANWHGMLAASVVDMLILDESHYTKNQQARRTKACVSLAKAAKHVICLTGTPILNRPVEILTTLQMLDPARYSSRWRFIERYCAPTHNGYGWDVTGASNTTELHDLLTKTVMCRRLKADVLKDLPAKQRTIVPLELASDTAAEYTRAERDLISWLRDTKGDKAAGAAVQAEQLVRIESLKQLCVQGKMLAATEWIGDYIETGKLVVFATHTSTVDNLMMLFGACAVKVDGSVSMEARQAAVDKFQTDPSCKLFIGQIKAAGVGLTLTAASAVAFLELGWTPGEHDQAEDRIHRIGQAESCTMYYLLAAGTMDEEIARLLDEKRKVLAAVLDGQVVASESLLGALIENLTSIANY